jgi:hypothetical protein
MKRILLWACCSLPAVTALAATPKLEVEFGASGLTSIKWDGAELLAANSSAALSVTGVDGAPIKMALASGGTSQTSGTLTRKYDGLVVVTEARQERNVLNLAVTYRNTGTQAIGRIDDKPLLLCFPKRETAIPAKYAAAAIRYVAVMTTEEAPAWWSG